MSSPTRSRVGHRHISTQFAEWELQNIFYFLSQESSTIL